MATYKSKQAGSFVSGETKVKLATGANAITQTLNPFPLEVRSYFVDPLDFTWSHQKNATGNSTLVSSTSIGRSGLTTISTNIHFCQLFGQFNLGAFFSFLPPGERDRVTKIQLRLGFTHGSHTGDYPTSFSVFNYNFGSVNEPLQNIWIDEAKYDSLPKYAEFDIGTNFSSNNVFLFDLPLSLAQEETAFVGIVSDIMTSSTRPPSPYGVSINGTPSSTFNYSFQITRSDPGFVPVNIGVQ